jgi:hypothetical protein
LTKGEDIRGCSLLPDGRMVFSCRGKCIVTFFNKEGVELFQYGKNRIRFRTYDALYIKEDLLMMSLTDLSFRFNIFSPFLQAQ